MIDWPALTAAKAVMAFAPLDDEPDLSPLLGALMARGTMVCIPKVDWFSGAMRPVAIESMDRDLALSRLNLREPRSDLRPVSPGELDLVLVPGLAFDLRGGRLGRGKGFYDRFLRLLTAKTVTCGVCFACQVIDEVPMEPHDVRLGALVHDRGLNAHSAGGDKATKASAS